MWKGRRESGGRKVCAEREGPDAKNMEGGRVGTGEAEAGVDGGGMGWGGVG